MVRFALSKQGDDDQEDQVGDWGHGHDIGRILAQGLLGEDGRNDVDVVAAGGGHVAGLRHALSKSPYEAYIGVCATFVTRRTSLEDELTPV